MLKETCNKRKHVLIVTRRTAEIQSTGLPKYLLIQKHSDTLRQPILQTKFLQLKGSVKELNISVYFFFSPITQMCSISDVLFTGGRGVSDISVLKYYLLNINYLSVDLMYHCTVLPIESLIFGITCLQNLSVLLLLLCLERN